VASSVSKSFESYISYFNLKTVPAFKFQTIFIMPTKKSQCMDCYKFVRQSVKYVDQGTTWIILIILSFFKKTRFFQEFCSCFQNFLLPYHTSTLTMTVNQGANLRCSQFRQSMKWSSTIAYFFRNWNITFGKYIGDYPLSTPLLLFCLPVATLGICIMVMFIGGMLNR
jgi:hypothetical protein